MLNANSKRKNHVTGMALDRVKGEGTVWASHPQSQGTMFASCLKCWLDLMKDSLIRHLEVKRAVSSKVFCDIPQPLFYHHSCSDPKDSGGNWEEYVIIAMDFFFSDSCFCFMAKAQFLSSGHTRRIFIEEKHCTPGNFFCISALGWGEFRNLWRLAN